MLEIYGILLEGKIIIFRTLSTGQLKIPKDSCASFYCVCVITLTLCFPSDKRVAAFYEGRRVGRDQHFEERAGRFADSRIVLR